MSKKTKSIRLTRYQFAGIALSGGKTEKTCVSVIEYFPGEQKTFLRHLVAQIGSDKEGRKLG